jgi:FPC/CPF motif-containing protein YcgG
MAADGFLRPFLSPLAMTCYAMKENPFRDEMAMENARLHFAEKGKISPAKCAAGVADPFLAKAHAALHELIVGAGFPCVGARAALHQNSYGLAVYERMASDASTAGLSRDLWQFAQSKTMMAKEYATFAAVFREPTGIDEACFEDLLWEQLRQLHRADRRHSGWDPRVSPDPNDQRFSFSFAGQAFYVIGMHANSSRMARRFRWPMLIFNPHEQFERLRSDGKWKRMQKTIRERDVALQGNINPMLSNFGDASEARQYSGRHVPDDWKAPFPSGAKPSQNGSRKCPFAH